MCTYHDQVVVRTYISVYKITESIQGLPAKCCLLGDVMSNTSWLLITKNTYLI